MSHATLSVLGLYNVYPTLFDLMSVPEGVDRSQIVDNILLDCAELEVLYANPDVLKLMIGVWANRELPVWTRVYKAELLEYNPIENYDRFQTDKRIIKRDGESGSTGTINTSDSGTLAQDNKHKYSAFDSGVLVDQTEDVNNSTSTGTGIQQSRNSAEVTENNTDDFTSRVHGNIGVTTSQQMLESELAIAPKLNIITYITDSFKKRFCLLVY